MAVFSGVPQYTYPQAPEFAVRTTRSKNFKVVRSILDDVPIKKFVLWFRVQTTAERNVLLAHYIGQYGAGQTFTWDSVPNFVDSGVNKTVAYDEQDGYHEDPLVKGYWNVWLTFVEDI